MRHRASIVVCTAAFLCAALPGPRARALEGLPSPAFDEYFGLLMSLFRPSLPGFQRQALTKVDRVFDAGFPGGFRARSKCVKDVIKIARVTNGTFDSFFGGDTEDERRAFVEDLLPELTAAIAELGADQTVTGTADLARRLSLADDARAAAEDTNGTAFARLGALRRAWKQVEAVQKRL